MFIVWGKKTVYRKLGYVADFCSICRGPRPFLLQRIGMAGHIYYISAGEGQLVGFQRTCEDCHTSYPADPRAYKAISKKPAPTETLQRETFPDLPQAWAERLALEEKLRRTSSMLSAQERQALLRDPFLLLSPKVEKRYASTHIDKEIGLSILGAFALLAVGPAVVRSVAPDQGEPAVLVSLLIGAGLVVWQIVVSKQRYLRREIVPVLASALKPLRPTTAELASVLGELKQLGHKMGAKLRPVDIESGLKR